VDEINLEARLLLNKVADIIEDGFVKEINRIVHKEARPCCKGCEMDDPSQDHHDCLMREEEEIWSYYYEMAKKLLILMNCGQ